MVCLLCLRDHLKQDTRLADTQGAGIRQGGAGDGNPIQLRSIGGAQIEHFCTFAIPADFAVVAGDSGGNQMDIRVSSSADNRGFSNEGVVDGIPGQRGDPDNNTGRITPDVQHSLRQIRRCHQRESGPGRKGIAAERRISAQCLRDFFD